MNSAHPSVTQTPNVPLNKTRSHETYSEGMVMGMGGTKSEGGTSQNALCKS